MVFLEADLAHYIRLSVTCIVARIATTSVVCAPSRAATRCATMMGSSLCTTATTSCLLKPDTDFHVEVLDEIQSEVIEHVIQQLKWVLPEHIPPRQQVQNLLQDH
jgi:hypothetical protein